MSESFTSFEFTLLPKNQRSRVRSIDVLGQILDYESKETIFSLSPLRYNGKVLKFKLFTSEKSLKDHIIQIMLNGDSKVLSIHDETLTLSKISVENLEVPKPQPPVEGTSIRIKFTSPIILENTFPELSQIYSALISSYTKYIDGSPEEHKQFITSALQGISTPDFNIESGVYDINEKKVSGFKGTLLLVIEKSIGLENLIPSLILAEILGLGQYTNLGFGRIYTTIKGGRD